MSSELILKKLEQIQELLQELERLLAIPLEKFVSDLTAVRAAERNFQLTVDIASDINTHILLERGGKTPDTYRESFVALEREGILPRELARRLVDSAKVRNILVHEYDFEEDYEKFYRAARESVPAYREYAKIIYGHVAGK
ncbi:MAG: DUF86 domain-containing protein [Patescibacteria group bacterium]